MLMLAQRIKFPNDVNGNPRRGWFLVDDQHHHVGFVDEGYDGSTALVNAAKELNMGLHTAGAGELVLPGEYGTIYEVDIPLVRVTVKTSYSALRKFDLFTDVPHRAAGQIVTSAGVPIYGIEDYGTVVRSAAGKDELGHVRQFEKDRGKAAALRALSYGEVVAVRGWCRSYRSMNGTITYGRAWLEATCI